MKKIISIIITLSLCMSMSLSAIAKDNDNNNNEIITVSAEEARLRYEQNPPSDDFAVLSAEDFAEFEKYVCDALKNHETKIDIKKYGYVLDKTNNSSNELFNDYLKIVTAHPEFYYAYTGCEYSATNGTVTTLMPTYINDFNVDQKKNGELDPQYTAIFNEKIEEVYNNVVQDTMSDKDKALAFFDYLVSNVSYCYDYDKPGQSKTIYSSYGAIVNGSAVCQGYSLAYGLFMDKCGIEWKYVNSDSMKHAWDMIKLDGNWYHVDVTWGDNFELSNPEFINHTYFLCSDENFQNREDPNFIHYGWNTSLPECTDNQYATEKYPFFKTGQNDDIYEYGNRLGYGSYKYNNGYFYIKFHMVGTYIGTDETFDIDEFAQFSFDGLDDGSKFKKITKEEYETAVNAPYIPTPTTPTPTPTLAPPTTPTPTPTLAPPTPKPDINSYTINNIDYDENGDLVVIISENIHRDNNDKLIVAVYDNTGQMCGISFTDITSDNDGNITVSDPITENSVELKILIWDSFKDLNTLAPSLKATIGRN